MMEPRKPVVGVVMTMLDLYRTAHPEMPGQYREHWEGVLRALLGEAVEWTFTGVAHRPAEVARAVRACEEADCDLLAVLPLAYAPSGVAIQALLETELPLLVVSTARDATLPYDMGTDHILANHAVHGVQDLANVLARSARVFELLAGHPADERFRAAFLRTARAAAAARVLSAGRVGQIGPAFEGMLDFDPGPSLADAFDLHVEHIEPEALIAAARTAPAERVAELTDWARTEFDLAPDATEQELAASACAAAGLEELVEAGRLDAVTMNFLAVAQAGIETMPFLGASALMSDGIGYAGEGDFMTAALVAAAARLAGESTFTEMFCPDYARGEVLLSHMGECNVAMARPDRRVRLVAKPFAYGKCERPLVPVFQLKPGPATVACVTQWPADGFRLIAAAGEILDAPDHPNLASPYSRIRFGADLPAFLEAYSRAGGTHHLALVFGDRREDLAALARLAGTGFAAV